MSLIQWIADELTIPERDVTELIASAPFRYKVYQIPKRSGGLRTIAQPASEVKTLQRCLVRWLQKKLPVHDAAMAYASGVGIRRNAEVHAQSNCILKLDFKDFFPSIQPRDFRAHWARYGQEVPDDGEVKAMLRLLYWRPRDLGRMQLSIGAPSSPFLSNTLMYDFDRVISRYADSNELRYTRYADDITVSSSDFDRLLRAKQRIVDQLRTMQYPRLELNAKKTVLVSKRYQRKVTGLVLTNDGEVSLGRNRKRVIRAAIHHYSKGMLSLSGIQQLRGWLAFSIDVEPEFVLRMKGKYGEQLIDELLGRATAR